MATEKRLSVFLNKHYSYNDVANANLGDVLDITYDYLENLEDKVYKQPKIALRSTKMEINEIHVHYLRYESELQEYVSSLYEILKQGPKLSKNKLNDLVALETKRDTLAEFIYHMQDSFTHIMVFLLDHFDEIESDQVLFEKFKQFIPKKILDRKIVDQDASSAWNTPLIALDKELRIIDGYANKLSYWKKFYYDSFLAKERFFDSHGNSKKYRSSEFLRSNISDLILKNFNSESLISPALIPKKIYHKHFENGLEESEFTFWFLKFNAEKWATEYYIPRFDKNLGNPITSEFIEAELKQLQNFENDASNLFAKKKFNITDRPTSEHHKPFQELKRIQSKYYKDKILAFPHVMGGNSPVDIYAKHIFYKNWLIDQLELIKPSNNQYNYFERSNQFSQHILGIIESQSRNPLELKNEDDYRKLFQHAFNGFRDLFVSAEEISKNGRTDLIIKGEFGTKIIEFKIWGRNDYKKVPQQLMGYMTDFEKHGYIFVVNENKSKRIDGEYISLLSSADVGLVEEVQKKSHNNTDYFFYESTHIFNGKHKKITHFIYNLHQ